jgi:chaperone LolA
MKQLFIAALAALMISSNSVQAQDAKAKSVLENASKRMKSLKSLKAGFTLKLAGANGKARDTKKGTFLMKGSKYHIILSGQEIICDGKTVWTYMKDANEVQVSAYNPTEQSISPTKLFTNFYDKEYNYRYIDSRTVGGKACDIVEMVPVNKSKQLSKVELAIDKAGTIAGGNLFEKNGNQYQYEVSGFTANAAIADNQFAFDSKAHPGVEVVDLR